MNIVWMSDSSIKTKLHFHLYFANVIDTFILLLSPCLEVPDPWVRCLCVLNVLRSGVRMLTASIIV